MFRVLFCFLGVLISGMAQEVEPLPLPLPANGNNPNENDLWQQATEFPVTNEELLALEEKTELSLQYQPEEVALVQDTQGDLYKFSVPAKHELEVFAFEENSGQEIPIRIWRQGQEGDWQEEDFESSLKLRNGVRTWVLQTQEETAFLLFFASDNPNELAEDATMVVSLGLFANIHSNNNWQNAIDLSDIEGDALFEGNLEGLEVNNREAAWGGSFGHGVWWKFTAPVKGEFQIDSNGSKFDSILIVAELESDGEGFHVIERDDDGGENYCSLLWDSLEEGQTVYFMLDSLGADAGDYQLRFSFWEGEKPRAENDSIAKALPMGILFPTRIIGDNTFAFLEQRERELGANEYGGGLWWSFSPAVDTCLRFNSSFCGQEVVLRFFRQEENGEVAPYSSPSAPHGVATAQSLYYEGADCFFQAGQTYFLLLESTSRSHHGEIFLDVTQVDLFSAHTTKEMNQILLGSSREIEIEGDMNSKVIGGGRQNQGVEYYWQAPQSGWVQIQLNTEEDVYLHVEKDGSNSVIWSGNWFRDQNLKQVRNYANWMKKNALFYLEEDEVCMIRISPNETQTVNEGEFLLSLKLLDQVLFVANDKMEAALPITQLPYHSMLTTQFASRDEQEEELLSNLEGDFLWWDYQAEEEEVLEIYLKYKESNDHFRIHGRQEMVEQGARGRLVLLRQTEQGEWSVDSALSAQNMNDSIPMCALAAGERVKIGVSSSLRSGEMVVFLVDRVEQERVKENDFLHHAVDLNAAATLNGEEKGSLFYQLQNTSLEEGEQQALSHFTQDAHSGVHENVRSVWYRWVAPREGVLRLRALTVGECNYLVFKPNSGQNFADLSTLDFQSNFVEEVELVTYGVFPSCFSTNEDNLMAETRLFVEQGQEFLICLGSPNYSISSVGIGNGFKEQQLLQGVFEFELLEQTENGNLEEALEVKVADFPLSLDVNIAGESVEDWEKEVLKQADSSSWMKISPVDEPQWISLDLEGGLAAEIYSVDSSLLPLEEVQILAEDALLASVVEMKLNVLLLPGETTLIRFRVENGNEEYVYNPWGQYGGISSQFGVGEVDFLLLDQQNQVGMDHDFIENALQIEEFPFEQKLNVSAAGVEEFESREGVSMWYRFEAPQEGEYTLSTAGSGFDTVLEVYPGEVLTTQIENSEFLLYENDDSELSGDSTSELTFEAQAGEQFLIRARSYADIDFGNDDNQVVRPTRVVSQLADLDLNFALTMEGTDVEPLVDEVEEGLEPEVEELLVPE